MQTVVFVFAVLALVGTDGRTTIQPPSDDNRCTLPFFEYVENGEQSGCLPRPEIADELIHSMRSRESRAGPTCPYCALGVWDLYPDWENCTRFNYCLNGDVLQLDCLRFGSQYFNPVTKHCDDDNLPSNNCLNRQFDFNTI